MLKKLFFLLCLGVLLFWSVGCYSSVLLRSYARFFTVTDASRGADALVVLSGNIVTRFPRAVELLQKGYAKRILLTEIRLPNKDLAGIVCDDKRMVDSMLEAWHLAVPVTTVPSLKGGATSTFDEAYDLKEFCSEKSFRHLIIVTDNHHTRRSLYAFRKVFRGTGIRLESMGASNDIFNERNWWRSDRGLAAYIMEGVKHLVYVCSSRNAAVIKNY